VSEGTGVGILCRNHRGIYDATFGALKTGARALLLNTGFAGPQTAEVCAREGVEVVIYDEDLAEVATSVQTRLGRFAAWRCSSGSMPGGLSLDALVAAGNPEPPPAPLRHGKAVVLTSGTTGFPKGAERDDPLSRGLPSLVVPAAILSRIPLRSGQTIFVAPPLFHVWGLGVALLAGALGSTVVVRRHFDAESTLVALEEQRCHGLVVVPTMLTRLLALGEDEIEAADTSHLNWIASSGSRLDGELAARVMDAFGDVLYNLYGSTEVAWATIATPQELRRAPGCAGRAPLGTEVRILDPDTGKPLPPGRIGRIFVRNCAQFSGYTDGGTKEVVDGLMSTGDLGHLDGEGRLFIDGREDEMIVSGGENVFPGEVEACISSLPEVEEVAVVGVDDPEMGQRLRACVVVEPGAALSKEQVKQYVRTNLARFKVPADVVFVESLPRNAAGKVLKRELA
jgi:fatty-acyl-CoA synthase